MAVNKIKILTGMRKKSNNLHTFNSNIIYIRLPVLLAIQVIVEKIQNNIETISYITNLLIINTVRQRHKTITGTRHSHV